MIRRVLKDVRETWGYWLALILMALLAAAYAWLHLRSVESRVTEIENLLSRGDPPIHEEMQKVLWRLGVMISRLIGFAAIGINYIGFLLIAVGLWGSEFKHHTMPRLLSQPISRRRIWWEKTLAYFAIISMVLVCQWLAWGWLPWYPVDDYSFHPGFLRNSLTLLRVGIPFGLWLAAMAASTGSLTSLFLRQSHTAFWAALVLPVVVFLLFYSADQFLILPVFHGSPLAWIESKTPSLFGEYGQDTTVGLAFFTLWACVAYTLAWLKFKRLEV